ncbi:MAG: YbjN domain-containing protein [Cyanobacteria bacterium]|nr:YbjN domain-containing protein [Cyanobacteriota bacterium]
MTSDSPTPDILEFSSDEPNALGPNLSLVDAIEVVIDSLDSGDTALVSHGKTGHLWKFQYGSVQVFVQLTGSSSEDVLTVWAKVLSLPVKNEAALTRQLLELNWNTTFEARFAIADGQVSVMTTRSVEDLSAAEISRAITIVAGIADQHDDRLLAEFPAA